MAPFVLPPPISKNHVMMDSLPTKMKPVFRIESRNEITIETRRML
jgi:hypothetical protein